MASISVLPLEPLAALLPLRCLFKCTRSCSYISSQNSSLSSTSSSFIKYQNIDFLAIKMMIFLVILGCCALVGDGKELIITYSTEKQSIELFKYFHNIKEGFFVDIGAYDPIYASNTILFKNWKGINVEASRKRHENFVFSRQYEINLNLAVSNATGVYSKLVEYSQDSAASIDSDYLKKNANLGIEAKEEMIYGITLEDLCEGYYHQKPKLMNIDIEGHGIIALKSNNWDKDICKPQILIVQRMEEAEQNNNQKELLNMLGYSLQQTTHLNLIYISEERLQFYKDQYNEGMKKMQNIRNKYWYTIFQQLFLTIIPRFDTDFANFKHIDPRNSAIYLHFARQQMINLTTIRQRSLFLHSSPRPILILHYNPHQSSLFIGSQNYTIKQLKSSQQKLHLIQSYYNTHHLQQIYILDHQIEAPSTLRITTKDHQEYWYPTTVNLRSINQDHS